MGFHHDDGRVSSPTAVFPKPFHRIHRVIDHREVHRCCTRFILSGDIRPLCLPDSAGIEGFLHFALYHDNRTNLLLIRPITDLGPLCSYPHS